MNIRLARGALRRAPLAVLLVFACTLQAPLARAGVRYVKSGSIGSNDGTSWANAYRELPSALAAAGAGDEIWVAAGTYKPTTGTGRSLSIQLKANVAVYGGFAGTETARDQRDWTTHPTILSGDLGIPGNNSDNSTHVVSGADSAVLDGFTVTGGYATGDNGGGLFFSNSTNSTVINMTVENCRFVGNSADVSGVVGSVGYGGAIYADQISMAIRNCAFQANHAKYGGAIGVVHSDRRPTATDCDFTSNTADDSGGADYLIDAYDCTFGGNASFGPIIGSAGGGALAGALANRCTFTNNTATLADGGAIRGGTALNCAFVGNSAQGNGGGVFSAYAPDCTFTSNTAQNSGGGRIGLLAGSLHVRRQFGDSWRRQLRLRCRRLRLQAQHRVRPGRGFVDRRT